MKKNNKFKQYKPNMPAPAEFRNDNDKKYKQVESISIPVEHSDKPVISFDNKDFERICIEALGIKRDICNRLNISFDTLQRLLEREPDKKQIYENSVKHACKDFVDSKLLQRIKGYNAPDLKVVNNELVPVEKHYPPNIEAMNTWYKINGFIIDKSENKNSNTNLDLTNELSNLSDDEIKAKLDKLMK